MKTITGSTEEICRALVAAAFSETDWRWVQGQCLFFLTYPDIEVRGLAATCLGHLARIHQKLDLEVVIPALKSHLKDKEIFGQVQEALEDIEMYMLCG